MPRFEQRDKLAELLIDLEKSCRDDFLIPNNLILAFYMDSTNMTPLI